MIDHDLSGHLSQYVAGKLSDTWGAFDLGGERFRMGTLDEARSLGWSDEDPQLLIRRESDGALFEVEVEVTAQPASAAMTEPPHDENHYRYHTPNKPLAGCANCEYVGWSR